MVGTALDGRGGVAAVVAVLRAHGLFESERVRYVATHVEGARGAKLEAAWCGFWAALSACVRERPAVVHVHAASRASFVRKSLVLLAARLTGRKTIFHLHGGGFRHYAMHASGPWMRRWIRHTLEASSVVIALSEGWAAFVHELAPRAKVAVVPNSVPLPADAAAVAASESASDALADAAADAENGTAADRPRRILYLGRLEAGKGVYDLLAAGALLAPRFPDLRLVFGGVGDAAALRRRAGELGLADRIDVPGWLDRDARDAELARAAVFCLPSHAEGLPMAMLEAMAAGKAVVATAVGAVPEALRDGDNGLLVPPRDVPALAGALAAVLGDDALRARLGGAARATVARHYSTDVVCGQLAMIYRELAGAAR